MADTERLNNENSDTNAETNQRNGTGDALPEPSEREAYFQSLRLWIQQAQMYQNISTCFPYYMMSFQGLQSNPPPVPLLNNNYQIQGQQWPFQLPEERARVLPDIRPPEFMSAAQVIARNGGYEYVIPPLYKRLVAEFIDFVVLFVLKLAVAFVAVDFFEFIDLEKFDIEKISKNLEDYKLAIEITSEILFLEFLYRLLVCFFEACCLSTGYAGRLGGATPGKALLGLRVISASAIIPVENRLRDTVLIYPGKPLTFLTALCRSVIKNILISLLFPLCFILFVFQYNRTGYDLICHVIVVEENMFPQRRNRP